MPGIKTQPGVIAQSSRDSTLLQDSFPSVILQKITLFMSLQNTNAEVLFQVAFISEVKIWQPNPKQSHLLIKSTRRTLQIQWRRVHWVHTAYNNTPVNVLNPLWLSSLLQNARNTSRFRFCEPQVCLGLMKHSSFHRSALGSTWFRSRWDLLIYFQW